MPRDFRCPKCGGAKFGSDGNGTYWCHNVTGGQPVRRAFDASGPIQLACGWRGQWSMTAPPTTRKHYPSRPPTRVRAINYPQARGRDDSER